jgi:hypothetical protein
MRWVAIFEDDPAADWVRKQHADEHLDYLARHRDRIVLAGGLRPGPNEWYWGGVVGPRRRRPGRGGGALRAGPVLRPRLRRGYRLYTWGKAPVYEAVTL